MKEEDEKQKLYTPTVSEIFFKCLNLTLLPSYFNILGVV